MPAPISKEPPLSIIIAAILMLLVGLSIGLGGYILLIQDQTTIPEIRVRDSLLPLFGLFLIAIGATELVAAVGVLLLKRFAWMLGVIVTVVFIANGAVNGYFFFGRPGTHGAILSIAEAALIIACLLLGRRAFAKKSERRQP